MYIYKNKLNKLMNGCIFFCFVSAHFDLHLRFMQETCRKAGKRQKSCRSCGEITENGRKTDGMNYPSPPTTQNTPSQTHRSVAAPLHVQTVAVKSFDIKHS